MDITAPIREYLRELNAQLAGGDSTEHSHRPALQTLLQSALSGARVTNEPRQIACGKLDLAVKRGLNPLGYVETKDIGKNLDDAVYQEQFARYKSELSNLLITDYLEFRLFRDGKLASSVCIGSIAAGKIKPRRDAFAALQDLLREFGAHDGIAITSADELAEHMAAKARTLACDIADALAQDEAPQSGGSRGALHGQLGAFKKHLIHDIESSEFADIYAQTIAYGMFAARLHDRAPKDFTREKAAKLIPAANPFLRKFFQHIAGYDLDARITWMVDALADLFRVAAVEELMAGYGKTARRDDPFLHFYETFLRAYNAELRKKRGVYYTPQPVVDFIVRAVDDILRGEFRLQKGLATAGKTEVKAGAQKERVHKVQILDPGTGTGTFLAAIIRHIHAEYYAGQEGVWPDYARKDLIPRLHGFEVLMTPYVMAHIKLDMTLQETMRSGEWHWGDARARVFLTNALEQHHADTETLFSQWIADEANEANRIKRDAPVMVVVGNPPYVAESQNEGEWIANLVRDYRKEPGGAEKLKERNSKTLNDDYVKFIRYGQHYIDRTGEGVLAYISNHGFLDNPTFRGMRWHLLQSFDKIYIIDLHGNVRKKETAPGGSADENVFNIMQGVSINFFVKTGGGKAGAPARVFHADAYGKRETKFQFLQEHNLADVTFAELSPAAPQYFFVPKDFSAQAEYEKGFKASGLFTEFNSGVKTHRDALFVDFDDAALAARMKKLLSGNPGDVFIEKYKITNSGGYNLANSLAGKRFDREKIRRVQYRAFDYRWVYYDPALICRARKKLMRHFFTGENTGLVLCRQFKSAQEYRYAFLTSEILDCSLVSNQSSEFALAFPLYTYPDSAQKDFTGKPARKPNLDEKIVATVATATGLQFTPEKESDNKTFAPIDLLDYIYAVLHAPAYRTRFNEFLKIDFPRVPYPKSAAQFLQLAKLGGKLRALHLLQPAPKPITQYPARGDHTITRRITAADFQLTDAQNQTGRVHINAEQYFDAVPKTAWEYFIGGYQPAQKYLKDRRGRQLTPGEITHYQNIIAALTKTAEVAAEIDAVWGG